MHEFKKIINLKSSLYVQCKCCKEIVETKPMEAASKNR